MQLINVTFALESSKIVWGLMIRPEVLQLEQ
jgi:hypothetical protein